MKNRVIDSLQPLLADYQVLYQKLRSFHWNVRGPLFFELHLKFEELYTDAATKVDDLAERVLALGGRPLSTLQSQLEAARLVENAGEADASAMVRELVDDLAKLDGWLREGVRTAGEADDAATVNMLEAMADAQEKTRWMLGAFLHA